MFKAIKPSTTPRLEEEPSSVPQSPALIHCAAAWERTRQQFLASGNSEYRAGTHAAKAYCAAMPPLSGYENICDFIACVGHGLTAGIIEEDQVGKFLFAARVALKAESLRPRLQQRIGLA